MVVSLEELTRRSTTKMGKVEQRLLEYTIELLKSCYNEGILVQISSGLRTNEDQAKIYGQGRPNYRWNGKLYGSKGNIVSNAMPGNSIHNYGLAIDYFLVSEDGKTSLWTVNDKWKRVGAIAKTMGFEWGGDWTSFRDYPHLQLNMGMSLARLKKGERPTIPALKGGEQNQPDGKIMWGKTELKPGQKGKVTILKPINLWEDDVNGKLKPVKELLVGSEYRVYNYREKHGGQYYVGAGQWITNMPTHIKYETPSKAMLEKLNSK